MSAPRSAQSLPFNLLNNNEPLVDADGKITKSWRYIFASFLTDNNFWASNSVARSLLDSGAVQSVFAPGDQMISLEAETMYFFDAVYKLSTGTTAHNLATLFGGTVSIASIFYLAVANTALGNPAQMSEQPDVEANFVLAAQTVEANIRVQLRGSLRTGPTSGSLIPQIQFDNATGGNIFLAAQCYFRITKGGIAPSQSVGQWS